MCVCVFDFSFLLFFVFFKLAINIVFFDNDLYGYGCDYDDGYVNQSKIFKVFLELTFSNFN